MKVVIVSCFDTYLERVRLLKEYYKSKGYETLVIQSDYSHRNKIYQKNSSDVDIYLHAKQYKKNLSISRLHSHYNFSKNVVNELNKIKPDIIHCLIPANSLAKFMRKYKLNNSKTKLYFDIIDLWPETMPINKFKNTFPFSMWKNIRDKNLKIADVVFTECGLFQEILGEKDNPKFKTLLWAKKELPILHNNLVFQEDKMVFCYLGSINNIIDIELIINILSEAKKYKKVCIHLIGAGEGKDYLLERIKKINVEFVDHGLVFDMQKKIEIFNQCNYGLNIMKPQVCVGLTMKSLDYLWGGLPIINTIQGDTHKICEEEKIGWNLSYNNYKEVVKKMCLENSSEQIQRRANVNKAYLKYFTQSKFNEVLDSSIKEK